jgi:hypothetical protein
MVVIYLILASLGVAAFVMLTDTRRNDNFQKLEQDAQARRRGDGGGGDGGGSEYGGDGGGDGGDGGGD